MGGDPKGNVAAYGGNDDSPTKLGMPIIGVCDHFFDLASIKENFVRSLFFPDTQRDPSRMGSSGQTFLHEMMHLREVAGKEDPAEASV